MLSLTGCDVITGESVISGIEVCGDHKGIDYLYASADPKRSAEYVEMV
jgi:hypothetical protein